MFFFLLLVGSLEKVSRLGCSVVRVQFVYQGLGCFEFGRGSFVGLRGFGKELGRGLVECKLYLELVLGYLQLFGRFRRVKVWVSYGFFLGLVSYGQLQFLVILNWFLVGLLRLFSIFYYLWSIVRQGCIRGFFFRRSFWGLFLVFFGQIGYRIGFEGRGLEREIVGFGYRGVSLGIEVWVFVGA